MSDLIEKLFEAREGSRKLDAEIARQVYKSLGPKIINNEIIEFGPDEYGSMHLPRYTTSIDDVITLLEPKTFWGVEGPQSDGMYEAEISAGSWQSIERATTPALALCIAALNMKEDG